MQDELADGDMLDLLLASVGIVCGKVGEVEVCLAGGIANLYL